MLVFGQLGARDLLAALRGGGGSVRACSQPARGRKAGGDGYLRTGKEGQMDEQTEGKEVREY